MSARLLRQHKRHADIVEWSKSQWPAIVAMRKRRWAIEKGVVDYLKSAVAFVRDIRSARKERKSLTPQQKEEKQKVDKNSPLQQYYASQDFLRRVKWKRITWAAEADFDAFSRRIVDSDSALKTVRPFSFMSVHVVRDPSVPPTDPRDKQSSNMKDIRRGTLTSWFLEQRPPEALAPYFRLAEKRSAPVSVNWETSEVRILDSATTAEIDTFLSSVAPRVQALQVRMDAEQAQLVEDIEKLRLRLGVLAIKVNSNDRTFWDDSDRATNPDYVTPDHVRTFIDTALGRATLLRRYVKGNVIRIVLPGSPYVLDTKTDEILIPANFADFSHLAIHARFIAIERFFNAMRALSMFWFVLAAMIIGDLEFI